MEKFIHSTSRKVSKIKKKKFERVIDVAITPSNLSFFNVQKNFTDSLHLLFQLTYKYETNFQPFSSTYI